MKKFFLLFATTFVLLQANAAHLQRHLLFSAKLEGAQEVPAVMTNARGIASFVLNKTRDTISVNISANGLSGAIGGIHIHTGNMGTNGPVLIDLTPFISGNKITARLTGAAVTANLAKMLAEGLYVNVHTAANPNGEIRGQIKLETDINFTADLNGMQEVPAVMTTAYGLGSFNLALHQGVLRFNIVCQNLSGTIGGAHLHFGAAGRNGAVTQDLTPFISGNVISGTITPTMATLDSLMAGRIYVNVHTAANPNGEIRAQLITKKGLTLDANLNGMQEVPAVMTNARGVAALFLNNTLDTLRYDIVANGMSGAIGGAHFHKGGLGANGGVIFDLTPAIMGNRIRGFITGAALNTLAINDFLTGDMYINLHTAANPNGEIRGQVFRLAREGYTINLTGSQQVPATTTMAYGSGIVSVSREQDNAHYMWVVGELASTANGAHFHKNRAGQNGGVIYDMTTLMSATGTNASAFGYWKSTDATPFLLSNSVQFRNDSVYLNIHNTTFPNGEIRGQVLRGEIYYIITSINPLAFANTSVLNIAPNPSASFIAINIERKSETPLTVKITDMFGKQIHTTSVDAQGSTYALNIDIAGYANGIYFVSVTDGKSSLTKKIVKF